MAKFYHLCIIITLTWTRINGDPITRNPLFETVDYLEQQERENTGEVLSIGQTQQVVNTVWQRTGYCSAEVDSCECLQADELFYIIEADTDTGLREKDFEKASVVLLYYLEIRECKLADDIAANLTYADYLEGLYIAGASPAGLAQTPLEIKEEPSFTEEQLHHILHVVNITYVSESSHKCFTSDTVFHDIGLDHDEKVSPTGLERLSALVVTGLLQGECIGESAIVDPDYFVEEIFETYGTDGIISDHGFEHLMADLGLGEAHDHVLVSKSTAARLRRGTADLAAGLPAGIQADNHSHEGHCHTADELLEVYDAQDGIIFSDFQEMCPSLIQLLTSGSCHETTPTEPTDPDPLVYLWATIAVLAVTFASISGIILVPLLSSKVYDGIMHFFIALAVSTLSGDALLHLLPESLGIHSHGNEDEHDHEEVAEPEYPLGKVLVIVAAIYVFFLFEKILNMVIGHGGHGHSHSRQSFTREADQMDGEDNPDQENVLEGENPNGKPATISVTIQNDHKSAHKSKISQYSKPPNRPSTPTDHSFSGAILEVEAAEKEKQPFSLTRGLTTLSMMVLIGDVLHNFMDGIAIGVAFTLDIFVGISTCIAIFCHEFPHEIGDFAVLVKQGMSNGTAFFWIIMSNTFGLGGVYAGIALGSNESVHQWMFAVTAGFFLYVSLVDLMPEMLNDPASNKPSVFVLYNIGLLLGWFILMVLAYFEGDIGKNIIGI